MANFTNYATLSYNGTTIRSNTVTGELTQTVSAAKTAVRDRYGRGERISYIISLTNSGTAALEGLTVSDDLGGYSYEGGTLYPLSYEDGTIRYYVNGVLQTAPQVTAGPPLVISGIRVPAGGSAVLIYEAQTTAFAPPASGGAITNTATVTGESLGTPITAEETVQAAERADLSISKALCPVTVTENGALTYTFVIENYGNTAEEATDNAVLSDTFDPVLRGITVRFNGTAWSAGTNYRYDETTGVFSTLPGQITVPAASYTQNPDGSWLITPGTATLEISGTV